MLEQKWTVLESASNSKQSDREIFSNFCHELFLFILPRKLKANS